MVEIENESILIRDDTCDLVEIEDTNFGMEIEN